MEILNYRPTKIKINLQAIQQNIRNLQRHLAKHVNIIAVVKANAYGHGDIETAKIAIQEGACMLAVATPEEAIHMRAHFTHIPILVMGVVPVSFAAYAAKHHITLTVPSLAWTEQLCRHSLTETLHVHVKLDTGMGRIGLHTVDDVKEVERLLLQLEQVNITGAFTHFATADEEDQTYFDKQVQRFKTLMQSFSIQPPFIHLANTAVAMVKEANLHYDAVRYGISLYGLAASNYVAQHHPFTLHQALSLSTELVHVKQLPAGEGIGYGAVYTTKEPTWVGTLPIGYADGLLRGLTGQEVLIDGKRFPIIGRICMDQCMIKLDQAYPLGKKVTLIGQDGGQCITIDEWAKRLKTINYEIPCMLSTRIPRVF